MPTAKNAFVLALFVFHVSTIFPVQTLSTNIEKSISNITVVKV